MTQKPFDPERWERDLVESRILYMAGSISSDDANLFGKAIVWLNSQSKLDPITLYINNNGGDVNSGLDIYDMIKHSKAPVNGIVYSKAYSMAAIILQACTTRQALPNSEILIHSIRLAQNMPLCRIEDDIDKALRGPRALQATINNILHERTGLSLRAIQKLNREDREISAKEALALNLIDEII